MHPGEDRRRGECSDYERAVISFGSVGRWLGCLNNQYDRAERRTDEIETDGRRIGQQRGGIHAAFTAVSVVKFFHFSVLCNRVLRNSSMALLLFRLCL